MGSMKPFLEGEPGSLGFFVGWKFSFLDGSNSPGILDLCHVVSQGLAAVPQVPQIPQMQARSTRGCTRPVRLVGTFTYHGHQNLDILEVFYGKSPGF